MIGQILEGHASSVTAIAATYSVATETVHTTVASASSDSTVVIWLRENVAGIQYELYGFVHVYYIIREVYAATEYFIWSRSHYGT